MTISEAVVLYVAKLHKKNRPASTIGTYSKVLNQFVSVIKDKPTTQLTLQDVERFEDFLYNRGCVPKTRRNKLAIVRGLLKYLYVQDLCTLKPEAVELPTVIAEEANFLTREEAQQFIRTITDPRDKAMMLVFLTSWLRVNELINIRLEDILDRSIIVRSGKGRKPRLVFINQEAERAIEMYLQTRGSRPGWLFLSRDGTQLTERNVRKHVYKYAQRAGLQKHVSPHTLRHTGATGFLMDGGNLEVAQKILGHTNIRTTMIYMHFTNDFLKKEYEQVTPGNRYTKKKPRTVCTTT